MKAIYFNAYKISRRIPLQQVSSCFGIPSPERWEHFIQLGGNQLKMVFKCRTYSKQVLLFDFGAAVFVNFNPEETRIFLSYLESVMDGVDYELFARYNERHGIRIYEGGSFSLYKDKDLHRFERFNDKLIPVIGSVLAKSCGLSLIEHDVERLMDEAEIFIHSMQKGSLHSEDRKYAFVTAHLLRFQYESAGGIRIFDRPSCADSTLLNREVYDKLAEHYELHDRFSILESKTKELEKISRTYSSLSYRIREQRLFLFEVFLLALFPLSYFVKYLMEQRHVQGFLELFIK